MSNKNSYSSHHGTLRSYIVGFVLSVVLSVLAFYIVESHLVSAVAMVVSLASLAAIQVVVHLICFLGLSLKPGESDNAMLFLFTFIFVVIVIGGTMFVMYDTAMNMMSR